MQFGSGFQLLVQNVQGSHFSKYVHILAVELCTSEECLCIRGSLFSRVID